MDLSEFLECSSKTGKNVKESFTLLTSLMLNGSVIKNSDNQSNNNLFEALKNNSF